MCPEIELLAIVGIFGASVWYSFRFLINGTLDIVHGFKCHDKMEVLKGGGKIVIIPLVFGGVIVGGLLVIELFYLC
jgi:hypothetical protein